MSNFPLTVNVPEGNLYQARPKESIGTDGCTFCVGVIAVDKDNFKTCAHFDCAIKETGDINSVENQASGILRELFPTKETTVRVGYCTTSKHAKTTNAIINAIELHYGKEKMVYFKNNRDFRYRHNGIMSDEKGELRWLEGTDQITTSPGIHNGLAEIK
jgi:hypothetical protein